MLISYSPFVFQEYVMALKLVNPGPGSAITDLLVKVHRGLPVPARMLLHAQQECEEAQNSPCSASRESARILLDEVFYNLSAKTPIHW